MIDNDYFAHEGSDNSSPQDRMAASGYFFDPNKSRGSGENIAYRSTYPSVPNQTTTTAQLHEDLWVDAGIAGRGHRTNIMNPSFKEVGTGIVSGQYTTGGYNYNAVMATEDFAYVLPSAFLTGVVYDDSVTDDDFYTPGEGLGGVTITANGGWEWDPIVVTTTTFSTGGYTLLLDPGTYSVTASGGALTTPITFQNVVIDTLNIKQDFVPAGATPDTTAPTAVATASTVTAIDTTKTFTVTYSDDIAIEVSTIGNLDVRVTGPNSFSQNATFVSVDTNSNGSPRTATYSITPPGGAWQIGDNGTYTISMLASKVSDTSGNFVAAGTLTTFDVNISDTAVPTAVLTASNIVTDGLVTKSFTVTYSDNVGINASSLDGSDIHVSGPNGFEADASLTSVDDNSNGTPRTGEYLILAPGLIWDSNDNGTYTIALNASQVSDTSDNFLPAGVLGTFDVNIGDSTAPTGLLGTTGTATAGVAATAFTVIFSDDVGIDVSTLDSSDIQITGPGGYSELAGFVSVDTNANGTPRAATYDLPAAGGNWNVVDNGTYTISMRTNQVADSGGNFVAAGSLGTFNVALADTTAPTAAPTVTAETIAGATIKTFTVIYVDDLAISVASIDSSDVLVTGPNSFSQLATLISVDADTDGIQRTATYSIAAPGGTWDEADDGTYTIELQSGQVEDTSGNFVSTGVLGTFESNLTDTHAPTRTLTAKAVKRSGATSYAFTIRYADDHAISAATIGTGDVQVTGPHGFKQTAKFVSKTSSANAGIITATYKFTPPGTRWDAKDNGSYSIAMRSGQVKDAAGNAIAAGKIGSLTVKIPATAKASLHHFPVERSKEFDDNFWFISLDLPNLRLLIWG